MGKALIIKGTNFSAVAVEQITIGESVPCTGISLSPSTASATRVNDTVTITPTVLPNNTTDTIVWTSSDDRVASVNNGIITIHGIGTATITATCGSQSATVTVNQSTIKQQKQLVGINGYRAYGSIDDGYNGLAVFAQSENSAIGQAYSASDGDLHVYNGNTAGIEAVPVPYGASSFIIETSDSHKYLDITRVGSTENKVIYDGASYSGAVRNISEGYSDTAKSVEYGECIICNCGAGDETVLTDFVFS